MNPSYLPFFAVLAFASTLGAQIPPLINYQGRVAVNGTNFEGTGQFRFALVSADGSQTFWSNDGSSMGGSEPASGVSLTVSKGLYSVLLGDGAVPNMTGLPVSVFANPDIRLRVWFDDGANGSQLLSPDQRLAPIAYVADGAVQTPAIAPNAITSTNIAPGAVNGSHVAPGSLGFSNLNVPAPPGPGQVLGYDGQSLIWTTPMGGGGSGPWSVNGANIYSVGTRVGLGTANPSHHLSIIGGPSWTSNGWKGAIEFDDGAALAWQANANGQRFGIGHTGGGLYMFRTNSDPGVTSSGATYDFFLSDTGRVGLGTTFPQSRLEIVAPPNETGLRLTDGSATFAAFVGSTGAWLGTTTSDPLRFFVSNVPIPVMTIGENGNVSTIGPLGIGTEAPLANVHVRGSGFVEAAVQSTNERAILALNSTIAGNNRVWTLESGLFGTAGLFGIYDRTVGKARLTIDANGTVSVPVLSITGGADIAEPFPMKEAAVEKGSVVVIDSEHPGRLKRSSSAYDRRVAGVVSGANGVKPGIALQQEGIMEGDENVALSGRVYVAADASKESIGPGDLLTTSDIPGHAMKATDHARAQGAILGKAMSSLENGKGLVLVLVSLQ